MPCPSERRMYIGVRVDGKGTYTWVDSPPRHLSLDSSRTLCPAVESVSQPPLTQVLATARSPFVTSDVSWHSNSSREAPLSPQEPEPLTNSHGRPSSIRQGRGDEGARGGIGGVVRGLRTVAWAILVAHGSPWRQVPLHIVPPNKSIDPLKASGRVLHIFFLPFF
ncbi:hypothetical protein VTK73DRAFT_1563 [Phialemonium thermophilum]|uniref:Uncharacterized protein n=1 Tax=Phialemonium thermophilum TaxID=223376 RepID=A0ABR3VT99_9PEZI